VGPHCMLGEGSQMGDKCSVKRSVIGRHCRIGSNVKVHKFICLPLYILKLMCPSFSLSLLLNIYYKTPIYLGSA